MTLTSQQQVELKRDSSWLEFSQSPEMGLEEDSKRPVSRYLTLASSLTSQLAGGLKLRSSRPADGGQQPTESTLANGTQQLELETMPETADDHLDQLAVAAKLDKQVAQSGRPLNRLAMSRAKFAIRSYTIAAAMPRRSRSLVDDAKLDTQRNRQLIQEIKREQEQLRASMDLSEEPATVLAEPEAGQKAASQAGTISFAAAAPPSGGPSQQVQRQPTQQQVEILDEAKEAERYLSDFPRHISDLDHCNHLLIKYEPELDPTHPGFHDLEYRQRRKEVAEVAFAYKHGERIPEIDYNERERDTWRQIYVKLREAYEKYACEQHNQAIGELEREGLYKPGEIPQLQQVSEFLERRTGWRLRPVAGLLSARDFLASLAFRVFQTTQYIRHWGNPEHSVEPDCIHELMGHIPMLCDPEFAQFSQELGLASLGAPDEQIERFATLYWFTVEFGLCREAGKLKCYGAGLLSSYGEMEHALESGKPKLKEFVPEETALETYDDSEYQVVYYVANSFNDAKAKMRDYARANLGSSSKTELVYDPYTCTIRELTSYAQLEAYANSIKSDMNRLSSALGRLKLAQAQAVEAK